MPEPDTLTPEQVRQILPLLFRIRSSQADILVRFLQSLVADPMWLSILVAAPDDGPYTEEQRRMHDEILAAMDRGEVVSHDEILKEFGLL